LITGSVINPTHHPRYARYVVSLVMLKDYVQMHGEWISLIEENEKRK
jgi:hypothetical protein